MLLPYKRPCSLRPTLPTPSPPPLRLLSLHAGPCLPSHQSPHRGLGTHRSRGRPLTRSRSSRTPHRIPLHLQTCLSHNFTCPFQRSLRKNIPRNVRRGCTPPQVQRQCHSLSLPRLSTQILLRRLEAYPSRGHKCPGHRRPSANRLHSLDGERRQEQGATRVGEHLPIRQ